MSRRPQHGRHRQPQRHQAHASVPQILTNAFFGTFLRAIGTLVLGCILLFIGYMKIAPVQADQLITNLSVSLAHSITPLLRPLYGIAALGIGVLIVWIGVKKSLH